MTRPRLFFLALLFLSVLAFALAEMRCPICGMPFQPGQKTSFETVKDGKPLSLCSFGCAHRFHEKFSKAPLFAFDYVSGKKLDVAHAYFLIKSKNLLKSVPFGMPPTVVAFSSRADALSLQRKLGDGEIVEGFDAVEKAY